MSRRVSRRTVRRSKGLFLEEILAWKRREIEADSQKLPEAELRALAAMSPAPRDFRSAIGKRTPAIVATVQRASPARGLLAHRFDAADAARLYADAGADALAVWVDKRYFQGDLEHLTAARNAVPGKPVLALDFVIARRQVLAARAFGADAVALFAGILGEKDLKEIAGYARGLGMAPLIVVESAQEVEKALDAGGETIAIACRDTRTFRLVEGRCKRLAELASGKVVLCWEPVLGVSELGSLGVAGVMTGEKIAKSSPENVRKWFRSFRR